MTLIFILTRNNHILLKNLIDSCESYEAGHPNDICIIDNESDDLQHKKTLEQLSLKYNIETHSNDRAEVTFSDISKKYLGQYKYYLFLHDDSIVFKDNWLKIFIDRIESNYCEPEIRQSHYSHCPVGRVCGLTQPWRDHQKIKGFSVKSVFLENFLTLYGLNVPIYKFGSQERAFCTNRCLEECGVFSLKNIQKIQTENNQLYNIMCSQINMDLQYPDEGIGPKTLYPSGMCWNKFQLICEFMNSVEPLSKGFRTIGLEGDGDIEQISGRDVPWGHNYIAHYGSPNMKVFLAKKFNTNTDDIHKKIYSGDMVFLKQCNKIIKEYFK